MACFTHSQRYLSLCSDIPLEETGMLGLYKKLELLLSGNDKSNSAESF